MEDTVNSYKMHRWVLGLEKQYGHVAEVIMCQKEPYLPRFSKFLIFPIPFSVLLLVCLALEFSFTLENEVKEYLIYRKISSTLVSLRSHTCVLCRKNMFFSSWKKELKPWRLLLITRMKVFRIASTCLGHLLRFFHRARIM